jgi:hypothetical protein
MNRHPYIETERDRERAAPFTGPYRRRDDQRRVMLQRAERVMLAGLVATLAALAAGWLG